MSGDLSQETKERLWTARFHLLRGFAVPKDGPLEALLDFLRPALGPEPGEMLGDAAAEMPGDEDAGGSILDPQSPPLTLKPWLVPIGKTFPIVGQAFSTGMFARYLATIRDVEMSWAPDKVVIHATSSPALRDRPQGLTGQHMLNLRDYYLNAQHWTHGPHLFTDEDEVWVFNPLTVRGTHSPSFNQNGFGIEMLGDYDAADDPNTGRGRDVIQTTIEAVAFLLDRFGLSEDRIFFHRDDPRTTHRDCPGRKIDKARFVEAVKRFRDRREFWW